jgi:hypothetical protein
MPLPDRVAAFSQIPGKGLKHDRLFTILTFGRC